MRLQLRRILTGCALLAALSIPAAAAAANGQSKADIGFAVVLDQPSCLVQVTSTKDISHYVVDGVKTELSDGFLELFLPAAPGQFLTVKSGTSVESWTVPDDCGLHEE